MSDLTRERSARALSRAWPGGVLWLARDHTLDKGDWSSAANSVRCRGSRGGVGITSPGNAYWCHTLAHCCQTRKRARVVLVSAQPWLLSC